MSLAYLLLFVALSASAILLSPRLVNLGSRSMSTQPRSLVAALALCLAALLYAIWFIEVLLGLLLAWWIWAALVAWGIGLGVGLRRRLRPAWLLTLGVPFIAAAIVLHAIDFSPRKPYRRFFDAIRPGMTAAEVRSALDREFPSDGRFRVPHVQASAEQLLFNLDLQDGRYNAESIRLALVEGRVTSKIYSGD